MCTFCRSRQELSREYLFAKSASIQPRTGLSKFAKNWPTVRKIGTNIGRVTGGVVNYNDEVTPDSQALTDSVTKGSFDSILGDREKCRGTYKEYILFDADQVYVEYILYYRRVY